MHTYTHVQVQPHTFKRVMLMSQCYDITAIKYCEKEMGTPGNKIYAAQESERE